MVLPGESASVAATPLLRRRTVVVALVVVLVAAVVGGVLGWRAYAGHRIDAVAVSWVGPPRCDGAEVTRGRVGVDGPRGPVIQIEPGATCRVDVRISNEGSGTVHLDRVPLPVLGAGAGSPIVLLAVDGVPFEPRHPRAIDTAIALDTDLAPGQVREVSIAVAYRDDVCGSAGTFWFDHWPQVEVSALGRSRTVAAPELLAVRTDRMRGCPRARGA